MNRYASSPVPRAPDLPDQATPTYSERRPSRSLAPWVECYWAIRAADAPGLPNRVLPDGCADLIVGIPDLPGPVAVGTMRTAAVYPLAGAVDLFGIRFHPGGALPFLGVPLGELTDRRIPLDDLWGPAARAFADVMEPDSLQARAAHAERVLGTRLRSSQRRDDDLVRHAVALLRRARGSVGVREAAAALGVGERRLQRAFDHAVGLGPKALARVLRFRRLLAAIDRARTTGAPARWAALALEAGYADQPHLVREFKALAGVTPSRYAAERAAVGFVQDAGDAPA
jgi:AraC-like DNA-binding protein